VRMRAVFGRKPYEQEDPRNNRARYRTRRGVALDLGVDTHLDWHVVALDGIGRSLGKLFVPTPPRT
jgi:hypothetical protein